MIRSCKANTVVPVEPHPFFYSIQILQVAEVLSVPPAEGQVQARLERIAAAQIPIADLREIYKRFPRGTKYRTMAIESIGNAAFERRLRRWGRYKEFRDECREYSDDIYAYVEAKKEQQKPERELKDAASEMMKTQKQQPQPQSSTVSTTIPKDAKNPKKAKTTKNTKQSNKPKEHEHGHETVTTKTVSAAVIRKGKGSKPTYVSFPFLEIDVVGVRVAARNEQRGRAVSGSTNSDTSPPSETIFSAPSSTTSVSSVEARPQDTKQQETKGTGKKKTWKGKNCKKYGKGPAKEKSEGGVKIVEKSG